MKKETMIKTIKALGLSLAPLLLGGVGGGLSSCQREDFNDGPTAPTAQQEIAFNTMVPSSQMATRADATIVNWKQTSLPPTEEHTYYRVDESGNVVAEEKTFYAGLFGCYTGPYHWASLVRLSRAMADGVINDEEFTALHAIADFSSFGTKGDLQAAATDILNQYYSANQMYNVMANIGTAASGGNTLTYSPIHLWPNDGKYMTFWGYYPYNPASAQGDYGIAIVNDENGVGEGKGMGKVHFTMHPDASQQNDFLISAPSVDCTREQYPLQLNSSGSGYSPKPVRLSLYHMLAQVRIYAYVTGADKLVYDDRSHYIAGDTYVDEYGMSHTVTAEEAAKNIPRIDEANSVRWKRTDIECYGGTRMRADIEYSLEFNNIKTEADFFPDYSNPSGATIGYETANTLGYATINHYIMNPYWFTYKGTKRERLNDNYMFGFYEDTPAYHRFKGDEKMSGYDDIDGVDWSNTTVWPAENQDPLSYMTKMGDYKKLLAVSDAPDAKHYNFAPGNTLLVVPQILSDDDVPHVVITAKGKRRVWNGSSWEDGEELTAKVTINMLKMGINWQSGFIYCYAFLDELMPGDDKVRGPESITVVFDTSQYTDQW